MLRRGLLLAALALAACSDDDGDSSTAPVPETLCVSEDCGSKTVLVEDIVSAENLAFTDSGRLFVSAAEHLYEITRDGSGAYQATSIADGSFGGIAQIGQTLYVNGFDGNLHALSLNGAPQLRAIHELGLGSPNGLSSGPDGELYIVNGPIPTSSLPDPKIVRVRLDPADPFHVIEQTDWLATGPLTFPNGVQRRGRTLYFTESSVLPVVLGSIQMVEVMADGSPGAKQQLGSFTSLPDDLGLAGDKVLICYYSNNQIALMGADGSIEQQTLPLSFDNPSSIRLGMPPLFNAGDIVVTEKGVVGLPQTPGYGSKLSVFRAN